MTQFTPRFTSDCGSPWVATTWPSFTATFTPQPTPQKRQGALDHFSLVAAASVTMFWPRTGSGAPRRRAARGGTNHELAAGDLSGSLRHLRAEFERPSLMQIKPLCQPGLRAFRRQALAALRGLDHEAHVLAAPDLLDRVVHGEFEGDFAPVDFD